MALLFKSDANSSETSKSSSPDNSTFDFVKRHSILINPKLLDIGGTSHASKSESDTLNSLSPFVSLDLDDEQEIEHNFESYMNECDAWIKSNKHEMNNDLCDDFLYGNFKCYTSETIETELSSESPLNTYPIDNDPNIINDDPWINKFWNALKMDQFETFNKKIMQINNKSYSGYCQII